MHNKVRSNIRDLKDECFTQCILIADRKNIGTRYIRSPVSPHDPPNSHVVPLIIKKYDRLDVNDPVESPQSSIVDEVDDKSSEVSFIEKRYMIESIEELANDVFHEMDKHEKDDSDIDIRNLQDTQVPLIIEDQPKNLNGGLTDQEYQEKQRIAKLDFESRKLANAILLSHDQRLGKTKYSDQKLQVLRSKLTDPALNYDDLRQRLGWGPSMKNSISIKPKNQNNHLYRFYNTQYRKNNNL